MTDHAAVRKTTAIATAPRPLKAALRVATELRRQIVTGQLRPGDRLPPENALQTQFAISRPTLREALRLLEAQSLITIARGKHGGAKVTSIDLRTIASQVGVFLQIEGTSLDDLWTARTIIEPPAAGMLAARRDPDALLALKANIEGAREASRKDLIRYAGLSAEFSMLIIQHCGNKTIHLLASLIYDLIRRQHEHVTERTLGRPSVDKLRQNSIRSREALVGMLRADPPEAVEEFWRDHLCHMRDLVLTAYEKPRTIDVLGSAPAGAGGAAKAS
nr:GntR family transcriptional regulator [Propylenella binzhouense]